MTWKSIPALLTCSLIVSVLQWYWVRNAPRKERIAYLALLAFGFGLGVLLYVYPLLPGPSELLELWFGPLGRMLIGSGQGQS
ncbi:hypothetical protein [Paenibacillus sp. CF384]|uniref:hypothetical protein n=1 Tax=Paenibacillus sp. CF384 TaxID=1884382 RepID=UPI000895F87C|nr:hypothetical protein [Paenibacillus sp. CF384]SDW46367.1 hypothetical protein SAMN05518855_1002218 [Paenibacillus sp. CF384]